MTKKEIVSKLAEKYGVEDRSLMKKTTKELENMLKDEEKKDGKDDIGKAQVKEIETKFSFEEAAEKNSKALEEMTEEDGKNIDEQIISEMQLNIYETIVRRFEPAKNLRIENLGAGDVYVGEAKENLIQEDNKIVPGQGKYIPNVSVLYITSASRPVIRIIY
jgi:arsenate reductase-like glutaredoxin family protein